MKPLSTTSTKGHDGGAVGISSAIPPLMGGVATSKTEIPEVIVESLRQLISVFRHVRFVLRPRGYKAGFLSLHVFGIPFPVVSPRIPTSTGAPIPTFSVSLLLIPTPILIPFVPFLIRTWSSGSPGPPQRARHHGSQGLIAARGFRRSGDAQRACSLPVGLGDGLDDDLFLFE
jgi:hypothetical protein